MRGEVGQAVLAVQAGVAEVDPELAGDLAVDRAGAAIGAGRPGLLLGRHALHFEMAGDQRVEGARQLGANHLQALLDIGHDLGAALVAFAELVARVLGQRLHPLADRTLGVAEPLEDRVHPPVQLLELLEAHRVDLVGRHVGGGRGLERPARNIRRRAAATTCRGRRSQTARSAWSSAIWRSSAGATCSVTILRARASQSPAIFFALVRLTREFDDAVAVVSILRRQRQLVDRLVDQEVGRDQAFGARRLHPLELAVELRGILGEAGEIGIGVGRGLDEMVGVEELGRVEIGADVLDHDIGRVAPAADGDVAIGQSEALECGLVGAAHHFDAGPHREGQSGDVDRIGAGKVAPERRRELLPARRASGRRAATRSAARSPVSMPSEVAPSGLRRSRFSAIESSSFAASASPAAAPALPGWALHPGRKEKAAVAARAATVSRRVSSNVGTKFSVRRKGGRGRPRPSGNCRQRR